jgi:opacity protein-like surface antigen
MGRHGAGRRLVGLGYEYLRREDVHLEVAETGSLHEEYSTHNVMLRARWKF